eukprot:g1628.t1
MWLDPSSQQDTHYAFLKVAESKNLRPFMGGFKIVSRTVSWNLSYRQETVNNEESSCQAVIVLAIPEGKKETTTLEHCIKSHLGSEVVHRKCNCGGNTAQKQLDMTPDPGHSVVVFQRKRFTCSQVGRYAQSSCTEASRSLAAIILRWY